MDPLVTVTLDTGLMLSLLDRTREATAVEKILQWHLEGKVRAYVSNRIFDPDTCDMRDEQRKEMRMIIEKYDIEIIGSGFRLGFSRLDGLDKLSGGFTTRSPEEMANFSKIVGKDPTNLPKSSIGNRLPNKIGDYDALRDHYADKREVFITLDTKDYLHITKRAIYFECLGLKIMSPSEFLEKCS